LKKKIEDFLIVTYNNNLEKLFTELYGDNKVLRIKAVSFVISFRFPIRIIELIYYKKKYWEIFSKFKNANVYFFFNAYAYFQAWLIKKMSVNNNIFYKEDVDISFRKKSNSIFSKINRWFLKVAYDFESLPLKRGTRTVYSVSNEYLTQVNAQDISINIDEQKISEFFLRKIAYKNNEILFLVGGTVEGNFVDKKEYSKKTNALLSVLTKYDIALKRHPRYNSFYSTENKIDRIANYIPANLIFFNFKIILGYFSATLFESANKNIPTISLLKYYKSKNNSNTIDNINFLNGNLGKNKKIYFPKTIDEIIDILNCYGLKIHSNSGN
jgi:hypothetical protein